MSTKARIKHDLLHYFETRGAVAGHLVSVRDFSSPMLKNYTAEEMALLDVVFDEWVDARVLHRQSPTEYILTPEGLDLARADRAHQPA
jgi:hypothetical protein